MLLKKLQILKDKPTQLHCDNECSIKLVNNHVFHVRRKHIEIQNHYMREKVHAKEIEIFYTLIAQPKKKLMFSQSHQELHNFKHCNPRLTWLKIHNGNYSQCKLHHLLCMYSECCNCLFGCTILQSPSFHSSIHYHYLLIMDFLLRIKQLFYFWFSPPLYIILLCMHDPLFSVLHFPLK